MYVNVTTEIEKVTATGVIFGPDWVNSNSSDLATADNNTLMAVDNPTVMERRKEERAAAVLLRTLLNNPKPNLQGAEKQSK